jgi:hypothetical protein
MKFVLLNNMAPRNPSVCVACATAGTGLLARSFHLQALLRDGVLPPMDGGEWICRIEGASDSIRTRCRLAEADR